MAVTEGGKPKKSSLAGQIVVDDANNRIYLRVDGLYVILFGILPNGNAGFIIVKPGEDAIDVFN